MGSSNSTDYTVTRNDIIEEAFEQLGVFGAGETISGDAQASAVRKLNLLVKREASAGLHLWAIEEGTLFLEDDRQVFQIGATGNYKNNRTGVTETSAVTGSVLRPVTLDNVEGLRNGDEIGITDDSSTVFWTQVREINGSVVDLYSGSTGTYSAGGDVYFYRRDYAASKYVKTELSAAAAAGDTTITVDSTENFGNGYRVGIELDDGTIHWAWVNGMPASATVATIQAGAGNVGIPSAAAIDNHVYCFQSLIEIPLRIIPGTVRLEQASGTDTPMRLVSREEYISQTNKASTGKPNQMYYEKHKDHGRIHVWPTSNDVKDVIHFSYERMLEDFDSSTDNPDFPIEVASYLTKALALELSPAYGMPLDERNWLKTEVMELRAQYLGFDSELASIFIQPNPRGR